MQERTSTRYSRLYGHSVISVSSRRGLWTSFPERCNFSLFYRLFFPIYKYKATNFSFYQNITKLNNQITDFEYRLANLIQAESSSAGLHCIFFSPHNICLYPDSVICNFKSSFALQKIFPLLLPVGPSWEGDYSGQSFSYYGIFSFLTLPNTTVISLLSVFKSELKERLVWGGLLFGGYFWVNDSHLCRSW